MRPRLSGSWPAGYRCFHASTHIQRTSVLSVQFLWIPLADVYLPVSQPVSHFSLSGFLSANRFDFSVSISLSFSVTMSVCQSVRQSASLSRLVCWSLFLHVAVHICVCEQITINSSVNTCKSIKEPEVGFLSLRCNNHQWYPPGMCTLPTALFLLHKWQIYLKFRTLVTLVSQFTAWILQGLHF